MTALPTTSHMPFAGHRTVAEWDRRYGPPVKVWCAQCEQRVVVRVVDDCTSPFCKAKALVA